MQITTQGERYVALYSYDDRERLKAAGWRWDKAAKGWTTIDPAKAAVWASHADDATKARLVAATAAAEQSRVASRATDADVDVPCPEGLAYLPYQRAGIAYAAGRPGTLIADEMGLGKTIQALGVINADPTLRQTLVVCPASLKINWQREATRWLVRPTTVVVLASGDAVPMRKEGLDLLVVVNYDVLGKLPALAEREWDLLVVDEAHLVKNRKAKRSAQVAALRARRRLLLTGTPIVNRPIELYGLLSVLDPQTYGAAGFWGYARRYANATRTQYGWDMSGASHLDELQDLLRRTVMVRRLKKDVLTELPAKRRQVVVLPTNGCSRAVATEQRAAAASEQRTEAARVALELAKAADDPAAYAAAVEELSAAARIAFTEMSEVRHNTAVAKAPHVVEHVKLALEDDEDAKIVVMAHHHDVIDALMAGLAEFGAVRLTGEDALETRQAAVDRFQSDPSCRVFVGSIHAAGVGITLTAAAHVVFAELDWVPGNISQAEDRCHRIGQRESVLVQHLVLDGSVDATLAQTLVAKQAVLDDALDAVHATRAPEAEPPVVPGAEAATARTTRQQITDAAATLTEDQVAAIHAGLRALAAECDGARARDGAGFSGVDAGIGKSLAQAARLSPRQAALGQRVLHRYRHTQVPAELVARIWPVAA